jgi:hypothetical protein
MIFLFDIMKFSVNMSIIFLYFKFLIDSLLEFCKCTIKMTLYKTFTSFKDIIHENFQYDKFYGNAKFVFHFKSHIR